MNKSASTPQEPQIASLHEREARNLATLSGRMFRRDLSFLYIVDATIRYPDTGESGNAYDVEATGILDLPGFFSRVTRKSIR